VALTFSFFFRSMIHHGHGLTNEIKVRGQ